MKKSDQTPIQRLRENYTKDMAESKAKRERFIAEANVLTTRIHQLEGALLALSALEAGEEANEDSASDSNPPIPIK